MDKKYCVIVRPGTAEIKALQESSEMVLAQLFPLIEITKGRKKTVGNKDFYPFDRRVDAIKKVFQNRPVGLDVTTNPSLTSAETIQFYNYTNGYENWVNYLSGLREENVFESIVPTLLLNYDDPNFEQNFRSQITLLTERFGHVIYRCDLENEDCYLDFDLLPPGRTILVIDYGYFPSVSKQRVIEKVQARLRNIATTWPDLFENIILAGTTFPNNLNDFIDVGTATFEIAEADIFDGVKEGVDNLMYGDYASVNPVRNDDLSMARGWIPRIEVPLSRQIYLYRYRRPSKESGYKDTYVEVAKQCKIDSRYPQNRENDIWGLRQINLAAEGMPPFKSPSNWLAVRMNIHLQMQVDRLRSINYFSN